jgi:hypothetical protein
MSMMAHGAGNLYGPHGAISHRLDDGDSMISMGPSGGGMHAMADQVMRHFLMILCVSKIFADAR